MGFPQKGYDGVPLADTYADPSAEDVTARNAETTK